MMIIAQMINVTVKENKSEIKPEIIEPKPIPKSTAVKKVELATPLFFMSTI